MASTYESTLMSILVLVVVTLYLTQAAAYDGCIAEKFYRFSKDHTACISKAADAETSGVSDKDKAAIVDKHNELRALQSASNMRKMVWDDEIAAIAQRWTDNCKFEHDDVRSIPGRFSVGQNLAAGHSSWLKAIQGWYDEISLFTYNNKEANTFLDVGHYTQVVWAESAKIGCGYTYCTDLSYKYFYACNYGPAGNSDWWKPYKSGNQCGDCVGKCDSNDLCDCGGKVCENGGTLDLKTCQCSCSKAWHKPGICALNCSAVVEPNSCAPGQFFDGKCLVWSNVPAECPEACNICPYAGVGYIDSDDQSSANITSASGFVLALLAAAVTWILRE